MLRAGPQHPRGEQLCRSLSRSGEGTRAAKGLASCPVRSAFAPTRCIHAYITNGFVRANSKQLPAAAVLPDPFHRVTELLENWMKLHRSQNLRVRLNGLAACVLAVFGTTAWGSPAYARVLDHEGNVVKEDRLHAVPNHHDDLVTLPNGDVVWAYVPDEARDYSTVPPSREDRVLAPAKRTFRVARLRYCE